MDEEVWRYAYMHNRHECQSPQNLWQMGSSFKMYSLGQNYVCIFNEVCWKEIDKSKQNGNMFQQYRSVAMVLALKGDRWVLVF